MCLDTFVTEWKTTTLHLHISPSALFYMFPLKGKTFHHIHFNVVYCIWHHYNVGACKPVPTVWKKKYSISHQGTPGSYQVSDAYTCNPLCSTLLQQNSLQLFPGVENNTYSPSLCVDGFEERVCTSGVSQMM